MPQILRRRSISDKILDMNEYLSLHISRFQPFTKAQAHADSDTAPKPENALSGGIHLWWARLDLPDARIAWLAAVLNPEEKNRADRLRGQRQRRFIAARGMLRILLGRYQDRKPEAVFLGRDAKGKPCVFSRDQNTSSIHFNLSHSGEMGLFGFSGDRAIGVDIEQIRAIDNRNAIARRFFAEPEFAALCRAGIPIKPALFFRLWTMKEAWVKASGQGLLGLRQVNPISLPGDCRAHNREDWQCVTDQSGYSWMLRPCGITAGYAAAVAVSCIAASGKYG